MPNNIKLYRKLCRHLDVTVDWLFFGDTTALPVGLRERLATAVRTAAAGDRPTFDA